MAEDIRVRTSWRSSGKRRRLKRLGGLEAVKAIEDLWLYCGAERADGDLSGLSNEEIADECPDWEGDADELVGILRRARLLDGEPGYLCIHDWWDHQPHVTHGEERAQTASANAHTRWHLEGKHAETPKEGCPLCESHAPHMRPHATACEPHSDRMPAQCSIPPSIHPSGDEGSDLRNHDEAVQVVLDARLGLSRPGPTWEKKIAAMCPMPRQRMLDAIEVTGSEADRPNWKYLVTCLENGAHPPERRARGSPNRSPFAETAREMSEWAKREDANDEARGVREADVPPQGQLPPAGSG